MKIAIIGAGNVGQTLGRRMAQSGHNIVYAVRQPAADKYQQLVGERVQVLEVTAAVEAADLVVLATPWSAAKAAVTAVEDFAGKPLLDVTNPIGAGFKLTHGHTDSGAEQVQGWAPTAKVVKAFNTTGVENMANPNYPAGPLTMFVCGDDEDACTQALRLCKDLGFAPVRVGGLVQARLLEPFAMLWIQLARVAGLGSNIGFRLECREDPADSKAS